MIELRDNQGRLAFILHPSLWHGLCEVTGISEGVGMLTLNESNDLDYWANNTCDNPSGQRADLARAVAGLVRVTGTLQVFRERSAPASGFWELVGQ